MTVIRISRQASRSVALTIAGMALIAVSQPAFAAVVTTDMLVKAVVGATCTVVQVPIIQFGSRTDPRVDLDAQGDLIVRCSRTTPYTITLSDGYSRVAGGYRRARHATLTNTFQAYQVYQDAQRTVVWDGSTTGLLSRIGDNTNQTSTIYARIPANVAQGAPGAYEDRLTVTVTW